MWPGVVAENCESTAYYRARYYNSLTGRFLSRDPEAGKPTDPKTLHKYLYAGGDPVNGWDPSGREEEISFSILSTGSLESAFAVSNAGRWISCAYSAEAFAVTLLWNGGLRNTLPVWISIPVLIRSCALAVLGAL